MDTHTIRLLQELRTELESESFSGNEQELKERLLKDIDVLLKKTGRTESAEYLPTLERLRDAVQRFEVTHPSLAGGVARVINSLSDMGV